MYGAVEGPAWAVEKRAGANGETPCRPSSCTHVCGGSISRTLRGRSGNGLRLYQASSLSLHRRIGLVFPAHDESVLPTDGLVLAPGWPSTYPSEAEDAWRVTDLFGIRGDGLTPSFQPVRVTKVVRRVTFASRSHGAGARPILKTTSIEHVLLTRGPLPRSRIRESLGKAKRALLHDKKPYHRGVDEGMRTRNCPDCSVKLTKSNSYTVRRRRSDGTIHEGLETRCRKCQNKHSAKHYPRDPDKSRVQKYRRRSKALGLECDLDVAFVRVAFASPCIYCTRTGQNMTLDRVDPKKSYTRANVVPACALCNRLKSDLPIEVWQRLVPILREAILAGLLSDCSPSIGRYA
jgi:hypothetical protein